MPSKFLPKEDKHTPAKSQPNEKKSLPIVFTSQMARNHIEQMNSKVAEVKAMYPRMFAPPQPVIPQPPETGTKK